MIDANLVNASFYLSSLTNANLTNANLSDASLHLSNLTSANLTGANLSFGEAASSDLTSANLTNANLAVADFTYANLTNANLTNANLVNAGLFNANLYGSNLTNANLSQAYLNGANLTSANLYGSNLTNANLAGANLTAANLYGADLRGALGYSGASAITTNAILPDGTIQGLNLNTSYPVFMVRNYFGGIPVHILEAMSMASNTTLVFQFEGNSWRSTISFDAGIPVTLDGTLDLDILPGGNPANLLGDSLQLFDWAGVNPSGQFAAITSDLPRYYYWDTSGILHHGGCNAVQIPEPSTLIVWSLLGTLAIGLGWWRKQKTGL